MSARFVFSSQERSGGVLLKPLLGNFANAAEFTIQRAELREHFEETATPDGRLPGDTPGAHG